MEWFLAILGNTFMSVISWKWFINFRPKSGGNIEFWTIFVMNFVSQLGSTIKVMFNLGIITWSCSLLGWYEKKHMLLFLSISCRLVLEMNEVIRLERERFKRHMHKYFYSSFKLPPHKQHNLKCKIAWLTWLTFSLFPTFSHILYLCKERENMLG